MASIDMKDHPSLYFVRYEKVRVPVGVLILIKQKISRGRVVSEDAGAEVVRDYVMNRSAYNNDGDLIGDVEMARFLCRDLGIVPEKISPDRKRCAIGKSLRDGLWYAWSHRGHTNFPVGEEIKAGSTVGWFLKLKEDLLIRDDAHAQYLAIVFAEEVS